MGAPVTKPIEPVLRGQSDETQLQAYWHLSMLSRLYLLVGMRTRFLIAAALFLSSILPCVAPGQISIQEYLGQTVWQLPETPEEKIDIGLWALIIAKEFDPTVDVCAYSHQLDCFIHEIRLMLANRVTDRDEFAAVRMFIYDGGIWNGQHPFEYDLNDPLGTNLSHQLLSSYIDTKKGNCISMPTLFLALMQRLDRSVPIYAISAPLHLFCRIKDRQTGDVWNFEATNGTVARNVWYIEKMNIPQKGIESGIYMRELSKKEFLGELISILLNNCRDKREPKKALQYAELALLLNPKSIGSLIAKSGVYAEMGYPLFERTKRGMALSESEYHLLQEYLSASSTCEKVARSLGWRPETPEEQRGYLQRIEEAKAERTHM
jgi:regulator of sirC expression with transglutaminase-like and TPR domain